MASADVQGFTVAGQLAYTVPPGFVFPLRVYFNRRQLQKLSVRAASMKYRSWVTDVSNRGMPVQEWIPCGWNMFAIHPADSQGGQTLTVNGVTEPPLLVNPTDTVEIEDEKIEMVEELAASVLQVKESTQIFAQASLIYNKFQADMKKLMRWKEYRFQRYYLLSDQIRTEPQDQEGRQTAA